MTLDKPKPPIEHYVVEWAIEDRSRYQRLASRLVPLVKREGYNAQGRVEDSAAADTILTIVLQVPPADTDRVTTALRTRASTTNGGSQPYLAACALAADGAVAHMDQRAELQRRYEMLENAFRSVMLRINSVRQDLPETLLAYIPTAAEVHKHLDLIKSQAHTEIRSMRAALSERSSSVAAQLLAAMPDEPSDP